MDTSDSWKELFPPPSLDEWLTEAERLLKGRSVASWQNNRHETGISIHPLYVDQDLRAVTWTNSIPGEAPGVRGFEVGKGWRPIQRLKGDSGQAELISALTRALTNGAEGVVVEFNGAPDGDLIRTAFKTAMEEAEDHHDFSVHVDMRYQYTEGLKLLRTMKPQAGDGLRLAPFGHAVISGSSESEIGKLLSEAISVTKSVVEDNTPIRSLWVSSKSYANAGAHAVQQLAFMLATGVEYLRGCEAAGIEIEKALPRLAFELAVGPEFFVELATLRASRLLWGQVLEGCSLPLTDYPMATYLTSNKYFRSEIDPHVNSLRGTTETLVGAVGEVEGIEIVPYVDSGRDVLQAERLAITGQLVVRDEMSFTHVADPGGGSFCLEKLTSEIADEAWKLFQRVESDGGMLKSLVNGWPQEEIAANHEARQKKYALRKSVLVGTNKYPVNKFEPETGDDSTATDSSGIAPLPRRRASEQIEQLRSGVQSARGDGKNTKVFVATLGPVAGYMARLDFIASFFEVGGLEVVRGTGYNSASEAFDAAKESEAQAVVACGTDETEQTMGVELAELLSNEKARPVLYVAGKMPDDVAEKYKSFGVCDYVTVRSDIIAVLSDLAEKIGVN